jgi:hypothetical protein
MNQWQQIPSIQNTEHPNQLRDQIAERTGRPVLVRHFDQFHRDFKQEAKTADELLSYAVLTHLFPRCAAAVLDGSEDASQSKRPLIMLVRLFDCRHALVALYDWHPVNDSPWNDGLYDHVRMWTWTHCEVCEGRALKAKGGLQ